MNISFCVVHRDKGVAEYLGVLARQTWSTASL